MGIDRLTSTVCRLFFLGAFVLLALAVAERLANASGYTFVGGLYQGGRLLEFGALLLVFVIALLLRQVRDELRRRDGRS